MEDEGLEKYKREILKINKKKCVEKAKICVYCGAVAGQKDHPVPLTYFHSERSVAKILFSVQGFKTLPACYSCNKLAGYSWSESFVERKETILKRFEIKYKKELNAKFWAKDELDELRGMLKITIKEMIEWDNFIKLRHENLLNPLPIFENL